MATDPTQTRDERGSFSAAFVQAKKDLADAEARYDALVTEHKQRCLESLRLRELILSLSNLLGEPHGLSDEVLAKDWATPLKRIKHRSPDDRRLAKNRVTHV